MQAQLREEIQQELASLLHWWAERMPDEKYGGFYGRILQDGVVEPFAVRGVVLNARILWTFSAASRQQPDPRWRAMADRAYDYLTKYFTDDEFGGLVWTVDYAGRMLETSKQVYAQAFGIFALSEYYKATGLQAALDRARGLYSLVQLYSYDCVKGGYLEAYTRNWQSPAPAQAGFRTMDAKKTMSTHLHLLEAFLNLYGVWPEASLQAHIRDLLVVFRDKIIRPDTAHLRLYFDEEWKPASSAVSYGHDVEAARMLLRAAEAVGDDDGSWKTLALRLTDAAREGLDTDGALWSGYDPDTKRQQAEKLWWPQAEAIAGFLYAWKAEGSGARLQDAVQAWYYVKTHLKDTRLGEWYWGRNADGQLLPGDKAGMWKSPYHNGRACMEALQLLA
ncbi:AGE family epimerase/isomerase [Chitinophaga lutea]